MSEENRKRGIFMKKHGKVYGYVRVSSPDQSIDRQLIAMKSAGVHRCRIFIEKQSGKSFDRPIYKELLSVLKKGDTLYVLSLDRLGRNYEEILAQWKVLTKDLGIDVVVMDMPILDTRQHKDLLGTFIADLVLQIMSYVAQTEREQIHERQRQGIAAAKARGVKFGRPVIQETGNIEEAVRLVKRKEKTVAEAAEMCGVSVSTFYRRARKISGRQKCLAKK